MNSDGHGMYLLMLIKFLPLPQNVIFLHKHQVLLVHHEYECVRYLVLTPVAVSAQYGLIVNGQKTKYLRCMRKNYDFEELQINSMYLEQVQSYKYLGSTVDSDNSIEEEIQYRMTLGNKAYYANQFLFKSRLVSKK